MYNWTSIDLQLRSKFPVIFNHNLECNHKVVFVGRLFKSKVYVHRLNGLSIQEILNNYELL